ncbi:MAPEG family protein [Pararhodobacter sp.]|uniref:MAPEG family protein n=1 Tax=Pararhodobacter sp. TaxID=2127056 RepID=UPI002FDCDAE3
MSAGFASLALAGFAFLVLVHVGAQSMLLKASVGNDWTLGSRDHPALPGPLAGRAERALRNLLETAPAFLALMLAWQWSGREVPVATLGASLYLGGRAAYLPAYLSGLRYLRTPFWLVASLGLALMLIGVLFT